MRTKALIFRISPMFPLLRASEYQGLSRVGEGTFGVLFDRKIGFEPVCNTPAGLARAATAVADLPSRWI
jgi:hypothetical protein